MRLLMAPLIVRRDKGNNIAVPIPVYRGMSGDAEPFVAFFCRSRALNGLPFVAGNGKRSGAERCPSG